MWKLIVGFILFAALAMFLLMKGGEIDMGGERHDVPITGAAPAHSPTPAPAAPAAAAPVAPVAAPATSPSEPKK
jgi:hypothetical protein